MPKIAAIPRPPAALDTREAFVAAARPKAQDMPWKDGTDRTDLTMSVNVRLPEVLVLKMEYVCAARDIPKRQAVQEALTAWADAEIRKLGLTP